LAFDQQIGTFLMTVICYNQGMGVYGNCKAYYGTVEVQGRGTLHCHMLLWIASNPSPQALHNMLNGDPGYKQSSFEWMESVISCQLPRMTDVQIEWSVEDINHPTCDVHEVDPQLECPPQVDFKARSL
ncbi:hypothetical protein PAXRUDRAFT_152414, partial [Paxillus rubicundulus Ve08.2h10]